MSSDIQVTTSLCTSTADDILVRGRSLPRELMGSLSFSQMFFFLLTGQTPTEAQTAVLDASLVAIAEHGLTPTAISARLTYTSAPEAMQGAVAAGLLSVGSVFVGTMEGCAARLAQIVSDPDPAARARRIVRDDRAHKVRLPGFGHPVHRPVDPRTVTLLALAEDHGVAGAHVKALHTLAEAAEAEIGKPLPPNVTGSIAAVLLDAGLPPEILRGVALVGRCAGLVGHIREEQKRPAMATLWHAGEAAVPYATDLDQEE